MLHTSLLRKLHSNAWCIRLYYLSSCWSLASRPLYLTQCHYPFVSSFPAFSQYLRIKDFMQHWRRQQNVFLIYICRHWYSSSMCNMMMETVVNQNHMVYSLQVLLSSLTRWGNMCSVMHVSFMLDLDVYCVVTCLEWLPLARDAISSFNTYRILWLYWILKKYSWINLCVSSFHIDNTPKMHNIWNLHFILMNKLHIH